MVTLMGEEGVVGGGGGVHGPNLVHELIKVEKSNTNAEKPYAEISPPPPG